MRHEIRTVYFFSDFGQIAQGRLLHEVLEDTTPTRSNSPSSCARTWAPTDAEARAETKHVAWYYDLLGSLVPGAPSLPRPDSYEAYPEASRRLSAVTEDDVWERGTCFGSPERVAGMLKRYLHWTGMNHIALEMRIGGLEHRKVMRAMELFARTVMPEVRAAAAEGGVAVS